VNIYQTSWTDIKYPMHIITDEKSGATVFSSSMFLPSFSKEVLMDMIPVLR
jgi:hypothetical protein